jgi:hypothetical protein
MDIETLIDRATALLAFMAPKEAAVVLADAGVAPEAAFLAIQAAAILAQPAAACADEGGQSLGGEMAHDAALLALHYAGDEDRAALELSCDPREYPGYDHDDGDYIDRRYTGRVYT